MNIYSALCDAKKQGSKKLAVLVDPDKASRAQLGTLVEAAVECSVDYFFAGGSLLTHGNLGDTIRILKSLSDIPVVIFPGSHHQIEKDADAILLLSLVSGRNPDLLIGQHVMAAPRLKASNLELLPTGYILVGNGNTTVQYISNTHPIPDNKPEIAACTALAAEQLGMKLIFAEAGSGAAVPVSNQVISAIHEMISIPLIVGGGIRDAAKAEANCKAGADVIVIGNILEKDPGALREIAEAVHQPVLSKLR